MTTDKVGFTKGPWSVFVAGGTLAVEPRADANGTRPNIVDWTGFDSNDQPYSVNRANAHLIAAAPDMYEAWEQWFDATDRLQQLERENDTTKRFDEALRDQERAEEKARAALAKARGEA